MRYAIFRAPMGDMADLGQIHSESWTLQPMPPFDISSADLRFTHIDIPVNEDGSPVVIEDEVDSNTSIDNDWSIHSLMEKNRQDVVSTSTNIFEVGAPYPRSRAQRWMGDYHIASKIDNKIELAILNPDSDRVQCNGAICVTPYRTSEVMIARRRRREISQSAHPSVGKRDHISDARPDHSPFAEQISSPHDIEESMSFAIAVADVDLTAFWAARADHIRLTQAASAQSDHVGGIYLPIRPARVRAFTMIRCDPI